MYTSMVYVNLLLYKIEEFLGFPRARLPSWTIFPPTAVAADPAAADPAAADPAAADPAAAKIYVTNLRKIKNNN